LRELLPGDCLVVYKLDRVSRSLRGIVNLLHDLTEQGVLVRSLHDSIDTTPKTDPFEEATRQAMIAMIGLFAELERAMTATRTSAGREHAKSNGVAFGRDPVLTPSQVARARRDVEQGGSVAAVARDLGVHRATLYRYLTDEERAERAGKVLAERAAKPAGKRQPR
jgi:DNA invertase Pin-like site-specific DNA recombinase